MEEKKIDNFFSKAYDENLWGDPDSRSGSGSNMEQTRVIRVKIPELIAQYKIQTMVDAPCGDLFWMKTLLPKFKEKGIKYTGLDIVPKIIDKNKVDFPDRDFNFLYVDLTKGPIPSVDLIFTRDCLLHLSYKNILAILTNYKTSGSKFLLVSTYASPQRKNHDVNEFSIGGRALNLELAPFKFNAPMHIIVEGCTEGNGGYTDKSLALWKLSQIDLRPLRLTVLKASLDKTVSKLFNRIKSVWLRIKNGLKRRIKKILFNR